MQVTGRINVTRSWFHWGNSGSTSSNKFFRLWSNIWCLLIPSQDQRTAGHNIQAYICHKEHNLRHTELYWAFPPPPTTRFRKCVSQEQPGPLWANHTKRKENKVQTKAVIQSVCLRVRQCKYSCWCSHYYVLLWLSVEKPIISARKAEAPLRLPAGASLASTTRRLNIKFLLTVSNPCQAAQLSLGR